MIKVLVNGCNGKMGQEVIKALDIYTDFVFIGGLDRENTGIFTFPVFTSFAEITEKPDVIIDFSVPEATLHLLTYSLEQKIPTVIATTGFSEEQTKVIQNAAKEIPIFQSANMSYTICLMRKLVALAAKALSDTDIEIIETHHHRKIDSPSGTALVLAESINTALDNSLHYEFDRHHKKEKRDKKEIGFSSIRGGNIVGEHTVSFFGENETFELTHKAYSRSVFAEGAIKAASYLVQQQAGFYSMDDLIQSI